MNAPHDENFIKGKLGILNTDGVTTIPIALDEANRSGRIQENDLILFCSFGGGFTWGASLIKW